MSEIEKSDNLNFIIREIKEDLGDKLNKVHTRFPPEPNGYLHIGHAKSIILNYSIAKQFGGKFNLRFDDTNPAKEDDKYVISIKEDLKWLGADYEDRLYFASNYFDTMYEVAIKLIKEGKAFVCELTPEEMKEYRGSLYESGKNSPYRDRSVEENLQLFNDMKEGKFKDGEKTLRAKIDMSSANINMRDPIIYRIANIEHHNTGDKWCIYPTYDFAHSIEDCIENITHSICTLEFEDHRPLYEWVVENCGLQSKPRQIEFAKLSLTNTIMGKRYIKALVDSGEVDGWDDPRLATISGLRRRGYTKESIWDFCSRIGVSKANNRVDIAMLEHCVREDLKPKAQSLMAVINPLKVVITNYEDDDELVQIENNGVNKEEMGYRNVSFGREIYIEREDFREEANKKFNRLTLEQEVRLKGAYFIKCTEVIKDENGEIVELRATYDKETKSGSGFTGRKVKGTIHWVNANDCIKTKANLYDYLTIDDENAENGFIKNENSLIVSENCMVESGIKDMIDKENFQFIRNGYYCIDNKLSTEENIVFNRTVSLKSSFKM